LIDILEFKMKKLVLGCGREPKKGWINSDHTKKQKTLDWFEEMRAEGYEIIELNVTETFPFEDNSIDYIFSEHMIEHVYEKQGIHCLTECLRVLKPGGIIRTVAPSRTFYENHRDDHSEFTKNYCRKIWNRDTFLGAANRISQRSLTEQGHYWVPTLEMLINQHEKVGFQDVKQCWYAKSEHKELDGVDLVDGLREYESIVVEGTK